MVRLERDIFKRGQFTHANDRAAAGPGAIMAAWTAWMRGALALARSAHALGEVPVGALVVSRGGELLARARSSEFTLCDATAQCV